MKWFPFFKLGKHTALSGAEFDATPETLDKIIEMNKGREMPIAIGHPKTSSPAWGWSHELKRVDDVLYAKTKTLVPEFEAMVKQGMFKNVSVSLNPDMTIRHFGFLGATPPAIEGLQADFNADANATELEFSLSEAEALNDVGSVFQRLREWLIDRFDLETADKVVSQWQIDNLKTIKSDDPPPQGEREKGRGDDIAKTVPELEAELATAKTEESRGKITTLETELAAEKKKNQTADFSAFLAGDEMRKKISPEMKKMLLPIMEFAAAAAEPIEFSAPDPQDAGKTIKVKKAPVELVKEFARAHLPDLVTAEELKAREKAAADKAVGFMGKVAEYAKEHEVSEGTAVLELAQVYPELHQEWLAGLKK